MKVRKDLWAAGMTDSELLVLGSRNMYANWFLQYPYVLEYPCVPLSTSSLEGGAFRRLKKGRQPCSKEQAKPEVLLYDDINF